MKYIKQFATNATYESYINSEDAFFPNVSVVKEVEDDEDVYYNPSLPPLQPFDFNLKVNNSESAITIGSADTSFIISTTPNYIDKEYDIYVNNTKITSVTGNYLDTYICGANPEEEVRTFVVKAKYNLEEESVVVTQPPKEHTNADDYLTFKITGNGNIVWLSRKNTYRTTISYSKDSGTTWTEITASSDSSAPTISVVSGDTVLFKGNNNSYCSTNDYSTQNCFSGTTCQFEVEGNIMSLIYGDNFQNKRTLSSNNERTFSMLFSYCTGLTSVEHLILPATTLVSDCYDAMFEHCTSLTTAPELPATTLATGCYGSMFYGCTALTSAPSSVGTSASTMCSQACSYMFNECTSLTTLPQLPATTIENNCYEFMFRNCTSLTTISSNLLPATTLAEACYYGMFENCSGLTTVPSNLLPATTLASSCYTGMFASCKLLTTAPELPATTLATSCYQTMFYNCSGLTTAPSSIGTSATTMAASACTSMFSNCCSLTTAPELPATTLAPNCYANMFSACTALITVQAILPATALTTACYNGMFKGCSSLTTAPALPATTLVQSCYASMFYYCDKLTTAPELPAVTLANSCYWSLFQGCTSLQYIKCLATNKSASNCTTNWVASISSTGKFVKNPDMSESTWGRGNDGIPSGWNVEDDVSVVTITYVEVSENINAPTIETDIDTSSISALKIITSYYTPVRTNNTKIFATQKIASEFAYGSTYYRINSFHNNILEHQKVTTNNSAGANVLTLNIRNGSQGFGGYYLITAGLSSPANNYPYSSFDTYSTSNMNRLQSNYTGSFDSTYTTYLNILCNNNIAGTRFYGMKVYNGSTLIYDLVPAKKGSEYGVYEKINDKFYSSQYLTGA